MNRQDTARANVRASLIAQGIEPHKVDTMFRAHERLSRLLDRENERLRNERLAPMLQEHADRQAASFKDSLHHPVQWGADQYKCSTCARIWDRNEEPPEVCQGSN